jgi:glycosyltransferase involved in cell wall biosynthesis
VTAVSVIIPTYNSRHLLDDALDALRGQTLPADEIEVIVVDDGSTDDTWSALQERAAGWPQLVAIHQENSGTPSVGRNNGLRRAHGRYVFFHDADDWMSADALRKLTSAADRLRSDIVVGRARVFGGRREVSMIRPAERADLIKDKVWTTLSAQKLFRRSFIERLRLEFCEDMVQGEDQVFVASALLSAGRVTTLTDDDYYFRRRDREDGGNLSRQPQSLQNKVLTSTRMTRLVTERVEKARQPMFLGRVMVRVLAPGLAGPFMNADGRRPWPNCSEPCCHTSLPGIWRAPPTTPGCGCWSPPAATATTWSHSISGFVAGGRVSRPRDFGHCSALTT